MGQVSLKVVAAASPVEELLGVLSRLETLPEFGGVCRTVLGGVRARAVEVVRLEDQLARCRALLREQADRLVEMCRANWTTEEIVEATGYPPGPTRETHP